MKLRYYLLISCILGCSIGYFLAPTLLPALEQALYSKTPGSKKAVANIDDIVIGGGKKTDTPTVQEPTATPEDAVAEVEEDTTPLEGIEEEEESETEAESTQPKKFARYAPEDDGRRPVNEEHFVGKRVRGSDWTRPKSLEKRLAGYLRTRLKGVTQEKVQAFLKDPSVRLTLAQWELLHRADVDKLTALMKDKETAADLEPLLNDLRWVSSFVYDGDMCKPEIALAMVHHFRQCDPEMDKTVLVEGDQLKNVGAAGNKELKRRVAAAIAVEFTRRGWFGANDKNLTEEDLRNIAVQGYMAPVASKQDKKKAKGQQDEFRLARDRYMYFKESIEQDLLNSSFEKLPDWLLHFPCGWKPYAHGDHCTGSNSSLRWLRDNYSTTINRINGVVVNDYLPTNMFGDSIFSDYYYEPFLPINHDNGAKAIKTIGSVCGGMSHVNAAAANANGIPAIAVGEPGHCAYAVYINDKWQFGFSMYPTHSPLWPVWGEEPCTWSTFQMMNEMYQQGALTRDAQLVATMAAVLDSVKNVSGALKLYELSASMQPLNKAVWKAYIATAVRRLARQPRKWLGVNEFICSSLTPKYPQSVIKLLREDIYPNMLSTLRTPQQKLVAYTDYFSNINQNEEGDWAKDLTALMDMQKEALGKNTVYKKKLYQAVIETVCKHPEFGSALTWVVKAAQSESKPFLKDILKRYDEARDDCEAEGGKVLLDAAVIRAAEDLGDLDLFNKYSEPYIQDAQKENKKSLPDFPALPGNLISPGSLVHFEGIRGHSNVFERPYPAAARTEQIMTQHALALTEMGGNLVSSGVRNACLIVQLAKPQPIGGIVIIPNGGSAEGYYAWELSGSADGVEWQKITDLPDKKKDPYVRIQWKKNYPKFKYLRVTSGSATTGINFKAFLVYDNKKSH